MPVLVPVTTAISILVSCGADPWTRHSNRRPGGRQDEDGCAPRPGPRRRGARRRRGSAVPRRPAGHGLRTVLRDRSPKSAAFAASPQHRGHAEDLLHGAQRRAVRLMDGGRVPPDAVGDASPLGGSRRTGSAGQQGRRVGPDAPMSRAPRTVYGKLTNRSRKSVAFAASRSIGVVTLKISWSVRSVELWS